jgi:hypothetical protein
MKNSASRAVNDGHNTPKQDRKHGADSLMAWLMARLEVHVIAQAERDFDLEIGKRRFVVWLGGTSDAPGDRPVLARSLRSGDRLAARQLGYTPFLTRVLLGTRLRRLRESSGMAPNDAGYHIRASATKISRMELGRVGFKARDVVDLLNLYGVTDPHERDALLYLVQQGNEPDWWHSYADIVPEWFEAYLALEEAASQIRTYDNGHIPDLFQTEDYARALARQVSPFAEDWEIDKRLQILKERQTALTRSGAPRIWALIDEAALKRQVGGPDVMHGQLRYLAESSALPDVTIQIIPLGRKPGTAAGDSFAMLRSGDPELTDVVYVENLTGAVYIDNKHDLERYLEVIDALAGSAETPRASSQMIVGFLQEWQPTGPSRRQRWPPQ